MILSSDERKIFSLFCVLPSSKFDIVLSHISKITFYEKRMQFEIILFNTTAKLNSSLCFPVESRDFQEKSVEIHF